MNRKLILGVAICAATSSVKGQVAKWLIQPLYDNIQLVNEESLIITDSLDTKIIWSQSGKRLAMTKDQLFPFNEGFAVTAERGSSKITGFYDNVGKFTPLSGYYIPPYTQPYFSNKHLRVKEGEEGNYYRFINPKGVANDVQFVYACPFTNGYASCIFQKKKTDYRVLVSEEEEQVSFSYKEKQFDYDDIEFISSVNDENIGIVVAKQKLYFFNGKDRSLSPVFADNDETNIKKQAKLEGDLKQCLYDESDSVSVLQAKAGKNDRVEIRFDAHLMTPLSILMSDGEHVYKKNEKTEKTMESPLKCICADEKYGIRWDGKEVLPPQFDALVRCFEDKAFVQFAGKYGMLQIINDEGFKIKINDGDKIGFRHQKYKTKIRADLPIIIPANNAKIVVDNDSICDVDMLSVVRKSNENGISIECSCDLFLPDSLPYTCSDDDKRNEIVYPIQVVYDGLKSPIIPVKVKAWRLIYYNVDINEAETSIHQGTVSFTVNIGVNWSKEDREIPLALRLQTEDSLKCEEVKLSETRYKCKVFELKEGINNVVVQISEEGCPPTSFPFEVEYTKPVAPTRKTPEVKENVKINKKENTRKTTLHLDI